MKGEGCGQTDGHNRTTMVPMKVPGRISALTSRRRCPISFAEACSDCSLMGVTNPLEGCSIPSIPPEEEGFSGETWVERTASSFACFHRLAVEGFPCEVLEVFLTGEGESPSRSIDFTSSFLAGEGMSFFDTEVGKRTMRVALTQHVGVGRYVL